MLIEQFLPAFSIVSGIFVLAPVLFYAAPFALLFLLLNNQPSQTTISAAQAHQSVNVQGFGVEKLSSRGSEGAVAISSMRLLRYARNDNHKLESDTNLFGSDFLISSFSFYLYPIPYTLYPDFTASLPPRRVLRELHERAPPVIKELV